MKLPSCVVGILLTAVSFGATQKQARLDAIWEAVDTRVSNQIDVWFDDGDFPKAIHALSFEAAYSPSDYDVVTNLGWMQENVEDWDAALKTYKDYWKNNPNDKDRAMPEAEYLFRRGRYAEVPPLVEPVLKYKPHPNNYRILAHAYEKLKKYDDARRVWLAYIAVAPGDLSAKANLAKLEKRMASLKTKS